MTDPSQSDRLAALAARSPKPKSAPPAPAPASAAPASDPSGWSWRPTPPSTTRVAATGASLVSFAAMVVAMGPLTAEGAESVADEPLTDASFDTSVAPPAEPEVVVEVIPNYVTPDGRPLTPEELALVLSGPAVSLAPTPDDSSLEASSTPAAQPAPPAAAPAAPANAPAPAATPTTAPPAAPAAAVADPPAAPVTAPPATAPPATAAPAPAPQPTPPPRSEASG